MIQGVERLGTADYEAYLDHQICGLEAQMDLLPSYETRYQLELAERLQRFGAVRPGMNVLCLGARLGAEVRAFTEHGCFAVGVDLNPGKQNSQVLYGDFHQLHFATDSVDVMFTNAVDHVFDLGLFISEICRVLKPDGLLIMDLVRGSAEGVKPRVYESLFWERIDDILAPFLAGEFDVIARADFQWPWSGQHVILHRRERMSQKLLVGNVITAAASLPGRCMYPELTFLHQLALTAPPGLPMIELGTFQGRTTAPLCAAAKLIGSEVITIDNYAQDPAFTDWPKGYDDDPECGRAPEEYAELTRQNLASLGYQPRIIIGDSATVPEGIEEVGLLFIDSEHTAEKFKEECDAWLPLMKEGSILACHDYEQPTWIEMTPAIDERITPDEWKRLGLVIWLIGFRRR